MQSYNDGEFSFDYSDLHALDAYKLVSFKDHLATPDLMNETLLDRLYERVDIWWVPNSVSRRVLRKALEVLPDALVERMYHIIKGGV